MSEYRIAKARPDQLDALPAIERAASRLFAPYEFFDADVDDTTEPAEFAEAQAQGLLWLAIAPDDCVVGFALVHHHGGDAHLEEIDVHPDHGGRGLGARLLEAVCAQARSDGLDAVTLTTFRDVPWNAPFYRKQGFDPVPAAEWSAALREIVEDEASRGLDPALRVVMRRRLCDEKPHA